MSSMMSGSTDDNIRDLQLQKMKFCMHKDDLAIGLGRPMYGNSSNMCNKKAYPSVISTLSGTDKAVQRWIAVHNFMVQNYDETTSIKEQFVQCLQDKLPPGALIDMRSAHDKYQSVAMAQKKKLERKINNMLEFYFVGVSLGLAYAHPHSGDTVASVMVGGLKTVLNGGFQVL
jgi:hypothetical protein